MQPPARRSRILHTLPDLALGGGQMITLRHLEHRSGDFDVEVVTLAEPDDLLEAFTTTGVMVHHLRRRPTQRLAILADLVRLIRRRRVEVVHVHGPLDREIGLVAAAITRVPVLCQIHSEYVHLGPHLPPDPNFAQRLRGRMMGALRDGVERRTVAEYVADSPAAAALFRPHVHQPITAMDLALPLDQYASAAADFDGPALRRELGLGDGPVLLNVSRLAEGKGQERLIAAMAAIGRRHPAAELVLVGDGDQRAALEARSAELGVSSRVHFLGARHDVPRLLHLGDVFVFGSRTEGLGVSAAEAMGAGLAVVAYRLPALDDYSTHEVTGLYPEQDDDDGFVDAVCRLLDDPALARRMGEAAHAAVADRFHPRATADTFEQAYRRILGLAAAAEPAVDVDLTAAEEQSDLDLGAIPTPPGPAGGNAATAGRSKG